MKKFKIIIVLVAMTAQVVTAQKTTGTLNQSVYVELLGASNIVGINYDARFKAGSPWGYRMGLGFTYSKLFNMFSGSNSLKGLDIPLEINYLFGKKRSKLDLGFGLNLGYYTEKYDIWNQKFVREVDGTSSYEIEYAGEAKHSQWGYFFFGNIGYRYQPAYGFLFRAGISPSFNLGGRHAVTKSIFPYLSFGYVF